MRAVLRLVMTLLAIWGLLCAAIVAALVSSHDGLEVVPYNGSFVTQETLPASSPVAYQQNQISTPIPDSGTVGAQICYPSGANLRTNTCIDSLSQVQMQRGPVLVWNCRCTDSFSADFFSTLFTRSAPSVTKFFKSGVFEGTLSTLDGAGNQILIGTEFLGSSTVTPAGRAQEDLAAIFSGNPTAIPGQTYVLALTRGFSLHPQTQHPVESVRFTVIN